MICGGGDVVDCDDGDDGGNSDAVVHDDVVAVVGVILHGTKTRVGACSTTVGLCVHASDGVNAERARSNRTPAHVSAVLV